MDIYFNNTSFSLSAFIVLILIGVTGLAVIGYAVFSLYRYFHPVDIRKRWIKTTATMTGKDETVMPPYASKYHIQHASEVYEAQYWVNGVKYSKFLDFASNKGAGAHVEVYYDSKHPSRVRESIASMNYKLMEDMANI